MRLLLCLGALALVFSTAPACDKKKDDGKAAAGDKKDDKKADKKDDKKDDKKAEKKDDKKDDKKAENPCGGGDKKAENPCGGGGDSDLPEACAKMKACIMAMAKAVPAAKASYEQAWKGVETAFKANPAAVKGMCEQAMKGYAAAPNAPAECK